MAAGCAHHPASGQLPSVHQRYWTPEEQLRQKSPSWNHTSEDCLYLNIFFPTLGRSHSSFVCLLGWFMNWNNSVGNWTAADPVLSSHRLPNSMGSSSRRADDAYHSRCYNVDATLATVMIARDALYCWLHWLVTWHCYWKDCDGNFQSSWNSSLPSTRDLRARKTKYVKPAALHILAASQGHVSPTDSVTDGNRPGPETYAQFRWENSSEETQIQRDCNYFAVTRRVGMGTKQGCQIAQNDWRRPSNQKMDTSVL